MPSPICERSISDALEHRRALLKFISPNNVGLTGSHERGYYLPKPAWKLFTDMPPTIGVNSNAEADVLWQDGQLTHSRIHWYGKKKSEYRMTTFGKDFPYLNSDTVGNLLVLIPTAPGKFNAYVLDLEEDIEEIQAALGVEVLGAWGVFQADKKKPESSDECIDRHFRTFAGAVDSFPTGDDFSAQTVKSLRECLNQFDRLSADDRLLRCMEAEYRLFRLVERKLCGPDVCRVFKDIDDFLRVASSILNRRKSRAGRSLENHVAMILKGHNIPFDVRATITGEPDILIPGEKAYSDPGYPIEKLAVVGIKNTCKDRWRQVAKEAPRVKSKYILTMQKGISAKQLAEMQKSKITLVVPEDLHDDYPPNRSIKLLTVDGFVTNMRKLLG